MTMAQMQQRLTALEEEVATLRHELDYQRAVEGIRRGLESADRGEGETVKSAFAAIRRKHSTRKR